MILLVKEIILNIKKNMRKNQNIPRICFLGKNRPCFFYLLNK